MLTKSRIKLINSLKLRKFRNQLGLFVAEGTTNVIDFINGGIGVDAVYATAKWIETEGQKISYRSLTEVDQKDINRISFLKNPPEVVGVFKIPDFKTPEPENITDIVIMLDDIRDPGNMGTIIRTADWFGIKDIVCSTETVDAFNPKVVQATMGSLSRVKVHYTDLAALIKNKPDYLKVFGTVLDGESVQNIPKPQKGIILIGNEAHGISDKLLSMVDHKITIPGNKEHKKGSIESLNASIATAIICYEFRRETS